MDLQGENRILVKEGLCRLKNTKNKGLQELIRANSLEDAKITAYHIGFVLGPCINASGRLDTAKKALLLLKTKDEVDAGKLAEELVELNTNRKSLTEKGIEDAMQCIETQGLSEDRVLVIYLPDCHESIAGIIAGRIRERYHRPVYVLTNAKEGVKGSGRSIEGYSMYEELCKCQDLLDKFGGHPMAGTQYSGFGHARANLYHNAPMVIVPPDFDNIELLSRVKELLSPAGFGSFSVTTADSHDEMIAFTSQMAHLVSNAYIKSPTAKAHKGFSAGSYKDMTRVAWLNAPMWSELFLENRDNMLHELDCLMDRLMEYRTAIAEDDPDALTQLLEDGKKRKEEVDGR